MTADDIRAALRTKYHDSRQYAIAEEVGLTTGFSHRRLDMMVLDCYNSNGFRIDGFEIKVSTSDLRRELEDRKADKAVPRGFLASIVRAIQARQPADQELRKEYERGRQEGKDEAERHRGYMADRIQREAAKLEAYDKLCARFSLYRDDEVEKVMDEFEAFRKLNIDWLRSDITGTINRLAKLRDTLGGPT